MTSAKKTHLAPDFKFIKKHPHLIHLRDVFFHYEWENYLQINQRAQP